MQENQLLKVRDCLSAKGQGPDHRAEEALILTVVLVGTFEKKPCLSSVPQTEALKQVGNNGPLEMTGAVLYSLQSR